MFHLILGLSAKYRFNSSKVISPLLLFLLGAAVGDGSTDVLNIGSEFDEGTLETSVDEETGAGNAEEVGRGEVLQCQGSDVGC